MMAVTDLTDSLPYWARSGVGYGGGPGPTGGPGAAPQGAGGSAQWLQYLQQMFGPGAAQAGEAPPSASNGGPSPDAIAALKAAQANPTPPIPNNAIVPPVGPPPAPPTDPATRNMPFPQNPGPAARNMPFPGQVDPRGYFAPSANPNVPTPAAQPVSAAGPAGAVPGPLATGGATAMGASANPRFVGISAPNATPGTGGGMLGGARGGPQGTALNLAGMFGGGRGAAAPVAGPMAKGQGQRGAPASDDWDIDENGDIVPNYGPGGKTTKAPSNYGPLQRGRTFGYKGGIPT